MRTQRLLAAIAAAVALATLVGFQPAAAQEAGESPVEEVIHEAEENGATHSDAECIELLAEGGSIDDCQAAPNPILPEINELIWGTLAFLVLFGLMAWKGFPAIKNAMNARTERIRGDLDRAESAKAEGEQVLAEYRGQLASARTESSRIIEEARQQADVMKRDLATRAEADIAETRQRAAADIEAAKVQAIADLRGEVTALAIGAAEQVIGRNLDDATNRALVETYINQVGAAR